MLSRILTLILSLTLLAGIGIAAFLVWSNLPPSPPAAPSVEFRSVEAGEVVTVAVNVHGDRVTRAELWSENQLLGRETNPYPALSNSWTVAWQWTPPGPGVYPLAARAFDDADRYGASSMFEVVVPPRGRLLFSSNREAKPGPTPSAPGSPQEQAGYALYAITATTRETALVSPARPSDPEGPRGSADRQSNVSSMQTVAFASNRSGAWHILTRPLNSARTTDLTPDLVSAQHPVWSTDGQRLAFEVTISDTTSIFVSDVRGRNRVQVTHGDGYDGQASFSPTGARLAFAGRRGGQWDIYAVDLDGTNLVRLTSDAAQDWQPAWSPDGGRIAFASNRSGISQIYVMAASDAQRGQAVRLTNFPGGAEQPAWSPDGNWIAFVAYTGEAEGVNQREIYLLYAPKDQAPVEGRGLVRLTQNAFDDTEPAWIGQ